MVKEQLLSHGYIQCGSYSQEQHLRSSWEAQILSCIPHAIDGAFAVGAYTGLGRCSKISAAQAREIRII